MTYPVFGNVSDETGPRVRSVTPADSYRTGVQTELYVQVTAATTLARTVSIESLSVGVLALLILGTGYVFTLRVETALALQERYAEAISWKPPSDDPAYYDEMRTHRREVFQFGGGVLLVVGGLLLAVAIYATLFVGYLPQ